jgi:hypothetical protein
MKKTRKKLVDFVGQQKNLLKQNVVIIGYVMM